MANRQAQCLCGTRCVAASLWSRDATPHVSFGGSDGAEHVHVSRGSAQAEIERVRGRVVTLTRLTRNYGLSDWCAEGGHRACIETDCACRCHAPRPAFAEAERRGYQKPLTPLTLQERTTLRRVA